MTVFNYCNTYQKVAWMVERMAV
jgi:hypothetical protein